MEKCEGMKKDVRKIQGFREGERSERDAGRSIPSRDAGIAPQKMRRDSLIVLLLAERARSECACSTRALEDRLGCPPKRWANRELGRRRDEG